MMKKYLLNLDIEILNICHLCKNPVDINPITTKKVTDDMDHAIFNPHQIDHLDYGINILGLYDNISYTNSKTKGNILYK